MSAFGGSGAIALVAGVVIAVGVIIYQQIRANSSNSHDYSYQERSGRIEQSTRSDQPRAPPGDTRRTRNTNCPICMAPMRNAIIQLPDCGHIFHDECFSIWRHAVVMMNPHAILCPTCSQA
ncbi:E3 ubiquitin-protein ligase RNF170-like [Athalia rosae]|uniref:E3 ubiquitin-protein ligase RNF170-like n=1 Tax=Athalia rosae TaxID=37344 RepID=UPI002033D88B|nr:E3 ubiquitin-protein ligase RNF170-like [Athalia rosae]